MLRETHSLNALPSTDPVDSFPIAEPTVNTPHYHTMLLNARLCESISIEALPASKNLNLTLNQSTPHGQSTFETSAHNHTILLMINLLNQSLTELFLLVRL